MSVIADALLEMIDPPTLVGFAALAYYMRAIDARHADRLDEVRDRIARLEGRYFTDGGKPDGQKDSR